MSRTLCPYCNAQLDGQAVCDYCGSPVPQAPEIPAPAAAAAFEKPASGQPTAQPAFVVEPAQPQLNPQPGKPANEKGSIGWWILGFFFPIVGLILLIVWHNEKKGNARKSGFGALFGVIVRVIFWVLILLAGITFAGPVGHYGGGNIDGPDPIIGTWEMVYTSDFWDDWDDDDFELDDNGRTGVTQIFSKDGRWECDSMAGKYGDGAGSWRNITDETLDDAGLTMDEAIEVFADEFDENISYLQLYVFDEDTEYESFGMILGDGDIIFLTEEMANGGSWYFLPLDAA